MILNASNYSTVDDGRPGKAAPIRIQVATYLTKRAVLLYLSSLLGGSFGLRLTLAVRSNILICRRQGRSATLGAEGVNGRAFPLDAAGPRAQAPGPRSGSASSSSGSTPPSRCFSDARITARILANSVVSFMSGSLSRWPPGSSGARLRSPIARSSSRNRIPMLSTVPGTCRRSPGAWPACTICAGGRRHAGPARTGWSPTAITPAPAHADLVAERKRACRRPGAGGANGRARAPAGGNWRAPGPPGL